MERQAASLKNGDRPDLVLLKQIEAYWRGYPFNWHQATEDVIYGALICRAPKLATDIYEIIVDHRSFLERLGIVGAQMVNIEVNYYEWRGSLERAVRDFVVAERAHIRREESLLFPQAESSLGATEWQMIDRLLRAAPEAPFALPVDLTQVRHSLT
jgi:hemerythrin-like domain-containing protein